MVVLTVPTLFELAAQSLGRLFSATLADQCRSVSLPPQTLSYAWQAASANGALLRDCHLHLFWQMILDERSGSYKDRSSAPVAVNFAGQRRLTEEAFTMLANFITSADIPVCHLDLSFTQVNDAELYLLARACSTSLQTLSLAGCHRVGPEGVQAFGRYCPTLTSVDFQCLDGLSDVALQDIVHRLQNLQSIDIGACQNLTNISFQIIASHGRALKRVSAAGCQQVTECDLEDLSKCTSMTSLSLRACRRLTDDSVRHLARLGRRKAHRGLPPLKWLDLGGCTRLTHRSILAIARENRDLEHLDLRGIALGEDTQLELTRLLPRCTYLNMGTPSRGHLNKCGY